MVFYYSLINFWKRAQNAHRSKFEKSFLLGFSLSSQNHKNQHSLEIWVVKLRFLLIYENMLKSTAVVSAQWNTKTRRTAIQATLLLIWFNNLAMIEKRWKLKKEFFIFVKNIVLTENWLIIIRRNNAQAICFFH